MSLLVTTAHCFFGAIDKLSGLVGLTTVPEVSVDELLRLQSDSEISHSVILVDVRTPEESGVSVIPGAITKRHFETNSDQYRESQVIAYCTVGGRSYLYARRLLNRGFNACNFKPSILGWCAEELDVVTPEGEPTDRVHVYSSVFSVPDRYVAVTRGD